LAATLRAVDLMEAKTSAAERRSRARLEFVALRLKQALAPTLSRKREMGRRRRRESLLPLAGEGGAKRRMRACLSIPANGKRL
jgi:hypothetical protein